MPAIGGGGAGHGEPARQPVPESRPAPPRGRHAEVRTSATVSAALLDRRRRDATREHWVLVVVEISSPLPRARRGRSRPPEAGRRRSPAGLPPPGAEVSRSSRPPGPRRHRSPARRRPARGLLQPRSPPVTAPSATGRRPVLARAPRQGARARVPSRRGGRLGRVGLTAGPVVRRTTQPARWPSSSAGQHAGREEALGIARTGARHGRAVPSSVRLSRRRSGAGGVRGQDGPRPPGRRPRGEVAVGDR